MAEKAGKEQKITTAVDTGSNRIAVTKQINADTTFRLQKKTLIDEIDDDEYLEFAIDNFSELMGYIAMGNLNIRIHSDIASEMWFGATESNL